MSLSRNTSVKLMATKFARIIFVNVLSKFLALLFMTDEVFAILRFVAKSTVFNLHLSYGWLFKNSVILNLVQFFWMIDRDVFVGNDSRFEFLLT